MSGRHRRPDDGDDVVFDIEFDAPEPRRARAAVVSSDAMAPRSATGAPGAPSSMASA
jgi:hypothetical protein